MRSIRTISLEQTIEAGMKLGSILREGDIICFSGNLGAGKTSFTSGIALALGISVYVTSPTFTIVNEYKGKIPLYHFDAYRLGDAEEMMEIGFEEYIEGNGIVVIEWAELIKKIIPPEHIWVDIIKDLNNGNDARIISINFKGRRYEKYEEKLEEAGQLTVDSWSGKAL